jgi:phage terminase large subunit-like protein
MKRRHIKIDAIDFIDRVIKHDEKGEPWSLSDYQRRVLKLALKRSSADDALVYRLVVLSEPKKSGKTFMAACLSLWWSVTNPQSEVIVVANDEE